MSEAKNFTDVYPDSGRMSVFAGLSVDEIPDALRRLAADIEANLISPIGLRFEKGQLTLTFRGILSHPAGE